ncbi:hydroxymethylglutaryl-CoA lyase [Antarcticimicrobium luteum]|uniref:Hydroxymethylglutaryl-CoA lyase n=1 Tax=Antarcticimicrobium luteum TaxID=2547397 RepID=A0A4R5V2K1_9RHOB|nr:hydroxymethylglutaryl-CoA lyase [Antarcticimicrobium luteum]TDK45666.1 hydroxymethylglutaryl-CoA lyase [Antarcticimicrobium luteum]
MSDFPTRVHIKEEGPREGFQIESAAISTVDKIRLIDRLSDSGLRHIQVVSFVDPRRVPGMADAEAVVTGMVRCEGVSYTALWLNARGFQRAAAAGGLDLEGSLNLYASDAFLMRNQNRTPAQQYAAQPELIAMYQAAGVPVRRGFVSAAFGCNFEGDIPVARVVDRVGELLALASDHGETLGHVGLGDTMGWATPLTVKRVVGAVRDRFPDLRLSLHLHDTRGMGVANAWAGLEMGVDMFDAAVGGLGGCPFAGHKGAAGNLCTEDFVFLCDELGIETGVDLEALIDCARLAEEIVGHDLTGSVMRGGLLRRLRR